jgi:hypothetical protein
MTLPVGRAQHLCKTTPFDSAYVLGAPASLIGSELLGLWAQAFILSLAALFRLVSPIAFGAVFALLQRDGWARTSNPPVAPSVSASKQKSVCIETCFKDTTMDVNHA